MERFLANWALGFIDFGGKCEENDPVLGCENPFGQLSHWFRHFITYFGGGSAIYRRMFSQIFWAFGHLTQNFGQLSQFFGQL
ncbi:hypothetical protein [Sutcliffiella horikoshii]|uniref:hypothetical protein n=1 Tax=Sutcliffiella horikoshii TaxID=79883 RepID=UPI003CF46942